MEILIDIFVPISYIDCTVKLHWLLEIRQFSKCTFVRNSIRFPVLEPGHRQVVSTICINNVRARCILPAIFFLPFYDPPRHTIKKNSLSRVKGSAIANMILSCFLPLSSYESEHLRCRYVPLITWTTEIAERMKWCGMTSSQKNFWTRRHELISLHAISNVSSNSIQVLISRCL